MINYNFIFMKKKTKKKLLQMVSIVDFVVENFICNREIYSQRLLILVQRLEWGNAFDVFTKDCASINAFLVTTRPGMFVTGRFHCRSFPPTFIVINLQTKPFLATSNI
ncbi:F3M18.24 [Arabidopsis thaliana]|uniref:F3M18.24 n=1 Tax=Arabidopsis thaliana TaxID=3702 RepID=Q9SGN0_ARATH|nr:F3M18.24 [Arabidopsis thaliana]